MKLINFTWGRAAIIAIIVHTVAWGIEPVTALGERADLILIGSLIEMTVQETGGVEARFQPTLALKGPLPVSPIAAQLAPSPLMKQHAGREIPGGPGPTGLWFLMETEAGGYEVLPTETGDYTESAAFLPLPDRWVPPTGVYLNHQLLSAVLASYESHVTPSFLDEGRVFVSLEHANRTEALAFASDLMRSPNLGQKVIGLAAGVRMGSDDALQRLAQEIDLLRSNEKFDRIIRALETYYEPNGVSSIPALRRFIELRSDVPGLDLAAAKALQKIGTRDVLPAMVLVLDSPDSRAVRAAAWFFHFYAAMAGPGGEINRSGSGQHPFQTAETARYTGRDTSITATEHSSFWKSWWQGNQEKLGFPAIN